jgi:hypothetical protein
MPSVPFDIGDYFDILDRENEVYCPATVVKKSKGMQ